MKEFEKWLDEVWDSLDGLDIVDKMQVAYNAGWQDALEWILKHRSLMFGGFEEWWKEIQSCSEVSGISYPYPKNEAKAIWKAGFEESVKSIKNTLKTELESEQIKHET